MGSSSYGFFWEMGTHTHTRARARTHTHAHTHTLTSPPLSLESSIPGQLLSICSRERRRTVFGLATNTGRHYRSLQPARGPEARRDLPRPTQRSMEMPGPRVVEWTCAGRPVDSIAPLLLVCVCGWGVGVGGSGREGWCLRGGGRGVWWWWW